MKRFLPAYAAAVALTFVLAACQSGTPAAPPSEPASTSAAATDPVKEAAAFTPPVEGTCLAERVDGDPGWDTAVPCTEPHVYEVLGSIDMPEELAIDDRAQLESGSSEARSAYLGYANAFCTTLASVWAGIDDLSFLGWSSEEVLAAPEFGGVLSLALSPEASWDTARRLICSVKWTDLDEDERLVASSADVPTMLDFRSADYPVDSRVCENRDESDDLVFVDCAGPHLQELVLTFNVQPIAGQEWVDGVDPSAVTDEQWAALDAVCEPLAEAVFGVGYDPSQLRLMADIGGIWGDDPNLPGYYQALCMARSAQEDQQIVGSVIGIA